MRRPHPADPLDDAIRQLHGAGCMVNIVPLAGRGECGWVVLGQRGGNRLMAHGPTRPEAWGNALAQARDLGMLGG